MNITIYNSDGTTLMTAPVTSSAELSQTLMSDDTVSLSWNDTSSTLIPMGAYIVCPLNSERYYMLNPYYPQAKNVGRYEYKPEFKHEIQMLSKIPFLFYTYDESGNVSSVECDWNFTGSGADLAVTLAAAIKEGIGVTYTIDIDDDIEAALSLSFSNQDILSAMNSIATAWDVEWWTDEQVDGVTSTKVIHFGEMILHEGGGTNTLSLTAGKHVESPNSDQKATFYNRFYIFGSTQNIPQDYEGAQANHVVNKRLTLNPSTFPNGYIDLPKFDTKGNALKDSDGNYILDDSLANTGRRFVKVIQIDDIYPKSNCRVKYGTLRYCQRYVRDSNDDKIELADGTYDSWYLYCFQLEYYDDTAKAWKDFRINKSTYSKTSNPDGSLIKGKTLSLHFNSGSLEGREFEATYHDAEKTFRSEDGSGCFTVTDGYFEVVHTEDNTIIIPNSGIAPKAATSSTAHDGDEVVVFNIRMPEEYYNVAYQELEEEGVKQIYELTKDGNEYTVESNKVYFSTNNPQLTLGRHVSLVIAGRTIDTRVKALTTKLDRSFEQSITFSKSIAKGTISTLLTSVEAAKQKIVDVSVKDDTAVKMSKKQLYAAQREMYDSMFDTDGYFTSPIAPVTIETAMLSVGATSQNFQLQGIFFEPNYDDGTSSMTYPNHFRITSSDGRLIHFGIDPDSSTPTEWTLSTQDLSSSLTSSSSAYYLYVKCPKSGTSGSFALSSEQIKYNAKLSVDGCYYFLVGILSSVQSDTTNGSYRVFNVSYGSTAISGRSIRTGVISSVDGNTYFNLDTGEISGNIKLSASSDNKTYIDNLLGYSTDKASLQSGISSAQSAANTAYTTASSAASTASSAQSTANTANSAATAANNKIDNISLGTRNYVLNSSAGVTFSTYSKNKYYVRNVSSAMLNHTFSDVYTYAFVSYYVDGWTEDYPPSSLGVNLGGNSSNDWAWTNVYAKIDSGYIQVTSTTRRYWYKLKSNGYTLKRYWLYTDENHDPATKPTVYKVMLSFGSALADWTPAPEDVDGAITAAKKAAVSDVDVLYALGTSSTTAPTSGWQTTAPTWQSGKYMWQRTDITTGSGTTTGTPTCIQGAVGATGATGADGVGILGIEEQYYLSSSSTAQSGGSWITTQPTWATGKYIWTRSKIYWDNATQTYTDPQLSNLFNLANETAKAASDLSATAKTTADSAKATADKALALTKDEGELLADPFLTANYTSGAPTPPRGNARLCNNRDNYWGDKIDIEGGRKLIIQCTARRHDSDTSSLNFSLGLWMYFPSGYDQSTATIKPWGMYAKATDLGAVSTDGLWHRYSLTATVPGANVASPNAPTQGQFYVQFNKASGADNTNGAFWVADLSVKCVRPDYLRDALTQATSSVTEISGGLVLSKMLAVKASGGVMVAGMTGTSQAVAAASVRAALPMIWAGASANTTDAFCSAPFRVYNDGHVDMGDVSIVQGASGSMGLTVSNGSLTLGTVDDGSIPTPLTQIVPQTYNTIDASLSSRVASVGDNTAGSTYNMTPTLSQTGTSSYSFSGIKTTTLKTIPSNVPSGTMTLAISKASMSVSASLTGTQSGLLSPDSVTSGTNLYNFPKVGTASVSMVFYVTVNGTRKTKIVESISASDSVDEVLLSRSSTRYVSLDAGGSKTAPIASTVAVKFAPGDVIGLLTETVITYSTSTIPKGSNVSYTKSTAASITLSWTASSENYNNMYYANGLLLSSSDKKYIAANSSSTATAILQARSGSAIFKFSSSGLLQSLNGSTFYRVNPLIWVAKVSTADAKNATATVIFNPMGKTFLCKRNDTGRIRITHNLNHTNYTIAAHGLGPNSGTSASGGNRYVYMIEKASTYFDVVMNLDHVHYDGICEILLYDLSSFS